MLWSTSNRLQLGCVITPLRIHATYFRKAFSRDFASPLISGEMVFYLKGDQRKKVEQPIPSSLPEAAGFGFGGSRRKDGVSYTNQVRFSGEISEAAGVPFGGSSFREPFIRYL